MQEDFIQALLRGLDKSIDPAVRMVLSHQLAKERLVSQRERQKLVEEITAEVIKRISATADVTDIVNKIESLKKELQSLYDMTK